MRLVDTTKPEELIDLILRVLLTQHNHLGLSRILCLLLVCSQEDHLVLTGRVDGALHVLELVGRAYAV